MQMLDLPPNSEGLEHIAASAPDALLLIPGVLPACITAAALGDEQAEAYLRSTAQQFAADSLRSPDEFVCFCSAAAYPRIQVPGSPWGACDDRFLHYIERNLCTLTFVRDTASSGRLAALKWLRALCQPRAEDDNKLFQVAAQIGHLKMLQYLCPESRPATWGAAATLRAAKHPHCLKWLLSCDPPCPCHPCVLPTLAESGDLETLKWIHSHAQVPWSHWDVQLTAEAARQRDLPMLQWLRSLDPPCE